MPELEVPVFNQKLKLSYLEKEKERLTNAINILMKVGKNLQICMAKLVI